MLQLVQVIMVFLLLMARNSLEQKQLFIYQKQFLQTLLDILKALERRLLHLGASTSQILDMYISMVQVLRLLDSSDLLLDYAAQPIRKYLLKRKDTVRKIVSSLTDSKDSELHGELRKGGSLEYGADSDDEDGGPGKDWQPKKKNKDLVVSRLPSGQDVLAMLVSIYGSTDLFVSEYRSILAEKLFSNVNYISDTEVATLELLKIRFGEESLHNCEVMLRDLEDSKRINNAIASYLEKNKSEEVEEAHEGAHGVHKQL